MTTIFTLKKTTFHVLSVCLYPRYPVSNAHASVILSSLARQGLYITPHYLINLTIWGKKVYYNMNCVF
jgi:hypothetical protein